MSGYSWSVPSAGPATGTSAAERATQRDKLWGRDLWLDVRVAGADVVTTARGDLALTEGEEALIQALIRRIITAPGEWATLPNYGAGARLYVKARKNRATIDELVERIRSQCAAEPRVERVQAVSVESTDDGAGLKINVLVIPRGRVLPTRGIGFSLEVN